MNLPFPLSVTWKRSCSEPLSSTNSPAPPSAHGTKTMISMLNLLLEVVDAANAGPIVEDAKMAAPITTASAAHRFLAFARVFCQAVDTEFRSCIKCLLGGM